MAALWVEPLAIVSNGVGIFAQVRDERAVADDLHIDVETRSAVDLKKTGVYVYAEDDTTDLWCAAYAFDDEQEIDLWVPGQPCPERVVDHVRSGGHLWAHNAAFERTIWRHKLAAKYDWPLPDLSQWNCTMARAYAMSLPGSLDAAAAALGLDITKDQEGYRIMMRMAKPRRIENGVPIWWDDDQRKLRLYEYCKTDVRVERELHKRLLDLRSSEKQLWILDQQINDRGIAVDRELCEAAREVVEQAQASLHQAMKRASNGEIKTCSAVQDIIEFCHRRGVDAESIRRDSVEELLARPNLPADVRAVLEIRAEAGKASVAKINALIQGCSEDGRARGLLQFHAASTGRWAGRRFQPQNIKRPRNKDQDVLIEAVMTGRASTVEMVAGPPLEVVGDVIRGMVKAVPPAQLYAADYSNIEGRGLAWLAGEQWKIEAFKAFDRGQGPDIYKLSYSRAFGIPVDQVTGDQRQIGKVMELACLGPDTLVLTRSGLKPITAVSDYEDLWDGVEWVQHRGLVNRGVRRVVNVAGIELTPDHLVLIDGTWTPAQQLVSEPATLRRALATGSASLQSSGWSVGRRGACTASWSSAIAAPRPTAWKARISAKVRRQPATRALLARALGGEKIIGATPTSSLTTNTVDGCSTGSRRALTDAGTQTTPGSPTMEAEASPSFGGMTAGRFSSIWSRWRIGTNRIWSWIGSTWTKDTRRGIFASSPNEPTKATAEKCETCRPESLPLRRVYDIACAGPRNRFTIWTDAGPLLVHNCGYQGGVGAFQTMAYTYGVHVTDERADELKTLWRDAHPRTKKLWWDIEDAAFEAVSRPGVPVLCGKLQFRTAGSFLFMRLPSGRLLCYPYPKLRTVQTPWGDTKTALTFKAVVNVSNARKIVPDEGNTSKWARISTYGGALTENAVQALARDVLAEAMLRVEAAGYPVVLTVHDEIVSEAVAGSADEFERLLTVIPDWATGFPISAEAWHGPRYHK